ncbi:MAG TPA: MmcQ/YjbR family DNA-binding protein [Gemmatimonadaceae bacterium]|nr:MmcQ/YjbR family DNA-binding protein [Gemmatimonadaceae bacterium]
MPPKTKSTRRAAKPAGKRPAKAAKRTVNQATHAKHPKNAKRAKRAKAAAKAPAKKPAKKPAKNAAKPDARRSAPPAPRDPVSRLRKICLSLPLTAEVEAWGEPTFRVKGKIFAMHSSDGNHHGAGRPAVWILSVGLEQDLVLRARPDRYFKPPYVGPSGWIGAWLDRNPPWGEIEELIRDAWRRRAPKKLIALLGE